MGSKGGKQYSPKFKADPGTQPELQPHAEGDLQRGGDHGDRAGGGRPGLPALRGAPGRRHEADPGEADHRAADRLTAVR